MIDNWILNYFCYSSQFYPKSFTQKHQTLLFILLIIGELIRLQSMGNCLTNEPNNCFTIRAKQNNCDEWIDGCRCAWNVAEGLDIILKSLWKISAEKCLKKKNHLWQINPQGQNCLNYSNFKYKLKFLMNWNSEVSWNSLKSNYV